MKHLFTPLAAKTIVGLTMVLTMVITFTGFTVIKSLTESTLIRNEIVTELDFDSDLTTWPDLVSKTR